MSNDHDPADLPTGGPVEPVLARRGLMRAGAVAAAATAGAVAASVASAPRASAAPVEYVRLGDANSSPTSTTITTDPTSATDATLALVNDGPTLSLSPAADENLTLTLGQIANTTAGPLIGVTDAQGAVYTDVLATGADLAAMPIPVPVTPTRVLDTRIASGRTGVIRAAAGAFDKDFRLVGGKWLDIVIANADDDATIEAVFLNLTVTGPLDAGFAILYPTPANGDARPEASILNYVKGQTIANGTFIGLGTVSVGGTAGAVSTVRVFAKATTHVVIDVTGLVLADLPASGAPAANNRTGTTSGKASALKVQAARRARVRPSTRHLPILGNARRR